MSKKSALKENALPMLKGQLHEKDSLLTDVRNACRRIVGGDKLRGLLVYEL